MTLCELKQKIENIERQLSSIEIPVRMNKHDAEISFNLEFDVDGNLVAKMTLYGIPEFESKHIPLRQRIINLGVNEELSVSTIEYKSSTVQNAACVIGRDMERHYATKCDRHDKVIRVIRLK